MEINHSLTLLLRLVRLTNRIHRRKEREVNQPFEQLSGMNIKHFHALYLIREGCDQPGELVRELGIPNSTATRLLDGLEKEGLLARHPNPEDLRQLRLALTPAGQDRYESLWAIYLTCLHQGLGQLPEATLQAAINGLLPLEEALQESPSD